MGDKKFEIRFDKLGNIVIDDPELQKRLKYLLETNGEITLRLKDVPPKFQIVLPKLEFCPAPWPKPYPIPQPPPPNSDDCPMTMCDPCGKLRLINERAYLEQWNGIVGHPREMEREP